ncbi:gp53-like domain-containing protein [Escherichia coli]|uniref:gp53-like domain-containing protein n=1 Tax=Escherichia coli TaxID=562 RepID=UPI00202BA6F5
MERTVFGGTNQADDLTSQITASFLRGWGIVGASEHPSLEDFNAAMYAMSQFIAYQHQMGVPEWHAEQEYHLGSICTHNGESYQSLQNANVGSQPPSAKWTPVLTSKNGLENLELPTLGIAGTGDILTALDWQQFNFVPGARYFIKSSDMSNVPAQIVITQPTFNAVMDVIGYDGITRHVDIWFSSTPDEYFSRYQVMIAGHQGSRTFSVRRNWTSSEPVPLSGGGTGASTPAGARSNLELGGLSVEDIAPINKGGTGADNVSSALNNLGIGPIANASEVTAGTSKKLIDAVLLKAFLPKRSFQANDVIRIPDQPGGLMVQFGTLTGVSGSDVISSTLTFPELFPNACLAVIPVAVSSDTGGGMVGVQVKTLTRSNADIFIYERNGGAIAAHSVQYIAIGW